MASAWLKDTKYSSLWGSCINSHTRVHRHQSLPGAQEYPSQKTHCQGVAKSVSNKREVECKLIITLLVIVLGGTEYNIITFLLFFIERVPITSTVYQDAMDYTIATSSFLAIPLQYPVVYGWYFKQICEPLERCLKNICCQ